MKKILFIFLFCILNFKFEISPVFALSFSDIFPPLIMEKESTLNNPPVTDVSKTGTQGISINTFVNQLTDAVVCNSKITVSGSWNAKEVDIYDKNGNVIGTEFKYPYDANDLNGQKTFEDLSNEYTRLVGAQYSNRSTAEVDPQLSAQRFTSMDLDGQGYLQKIYSSNQKQCLQGQAVGDMMKFWNNEDTNTADIQIGWANGGNFISMLDGSCSNSSCRPVTVGEVVYYFFKYIPEIPLMFSDCATMTPAPAFSFDEYFSHYSNQFKKQLSPLLSKENYVLLREFLPLKALGPMNQKLILTNYDSVSSQWPNFSPGGENKVNKKRNIPFAAVGNPYLSNQLSPLNADRSFGKVFDCGDFIVVGAVGVDKPSTVEFTAYVKGLVRGGIRDEPSWSFSYGNPLKTITEKKLTQVISETATDFANFIPAGEELDKLKELPASSKVTDESPIDPGYQATEVFKSMRAWLLPASWQKQ